MGDWQPWEDWEAWSVESRLTAPIVWMKALGVRARGIYSRVAYSVAHDLGACCVHLLDGEKAAVEAVSVFAI